MSWIKSHASKTKVLQFQAPGPQGMASFGNGVIVNITSEIKMSSH